ncbi:MAG TPA: hypothetical protein VFN37_02915 [Candidatus Baltobacteraceae bacterium]|nr:hypothetical protein [Candidatus Baltobacteraceae bacterium]
MRTSASLAAFSAIALLAACGGGGGGGSTTPPTGPGGGGPPPSTSTPAPTPTPTTAPPTGITVSSTEYVAYDSTPAHSWGTDNWQTNGVTAPGDAADGDTSTGGTGSNAVDGVSCSLPNGEATGTYYHKHAFVGIYVNGSAYAVPDAVGMVNPDGNEPIFTFQCAYNIHTHADSGVIHVEDPAVAANAAAPAQYNLQTLFDIWGQPMATLPISGISGPPAIYVGTPSGKDSKGNPLVTSYSSVSDPTQVMLTEDTAIWLIYGTPPAGGVPQVGFGIE